MSHDDPFALPEGEGTIIRPAPGGRRPLASSPLPSAAAPPLSVEDLGRIGALNPLLAAANPLLALAVQLRTSPSAGDLGMLRETLVRSIREFESNARSRGVRPEVVTAARYCLCTLVDEGIGTTPWGAGGAWAKQSLLVTFHNEAWGGEKFFSLLQRVSEDARGNVDLLELMYLCLAFGLQGKYRVIEGGRSQLDELRERLFLNIRAQRGEPDNELSQHWQSSAQKKKASLTSWMPLWVGAAGAALCLLLVFLFLSWTLNRSSDSVYAALHDIPDRFAPVVQKPSQPAAPTGLSSLLQPEIAAGWVSVTELADRAIIRIRGDNLFESGNAAVNAQYYPVLARIAEALNSTGGPITVTGHTDDRRIFSARFPSNWDLSKARAEAVMAILASALATAGRLRAEGRADQEPILANDTPEHRALNRRVDVTVFTTGLVNKRPGTGASK